MTREELSQKLLEIDDLKDAIDKLSTDALSHLDIKVYSRPINGYYNAYDYMLSSKKVEVRPKLEDEVSKEIIIPKIKAEMKLKPGIPIPTDVLLSPWPDSNENVLEQILKNPLGIGFKGYLPAIDNLEVIKTVIKYGEYNLLRMASIDLYNEKINDDETLLDIMLKNKILPWAKYIDIDEYFNNFLSKSWPTAKDIILVKVKDDKTLLEVLIENKISFKFDSILRYAPLGVKKAILLICLKEKRLDLIRDSYDLFADSIEGFREKVENYNPNDYNIDFQNISFESQNKIKEFYQVYATGTQSDKEILELAVKSFLSYLAVDKTKATEDMDSLIWIKQSHPEFHFEYDENLSSVFSSSTEKIRIENSNRLDEFNHELAHAIHHYIIGDSFVPDDIQEEIELGRKEGQNITKIEGVFNELNREVASLASKNFLETKKKFCKFIIESYGSLETYESLLQSEFQEMLANSSDVKGYVDENFNGNASAEVKKAIDSITKNMDLTSAVKVLTNNCLQVEYKMFEARLLSETKSEFLMYYNFIDAYYAGAIGDWIEDDSVASSFYSVHNRQYFNVDKGNQYCEMFADYVALLKSPNGKYYIDKLREKGFGSIIDKIDKVYRYSGYEENVSLT